MCTSHRGSSFISDLSTSTEVRLVLTVVTNLTAVEKINNCGTSYIVPDLEYVTIKVQQDGRLKVTIDADPVAHKATTALSKARDDLSERLKELKVQEAQ